ncbi:MAG: FHA domain-containing protein, partial [Hyphomicrobiaceae bacterium]
MHWRSTCLVTAGLLLWSVAPSGASDVRLDAACKANTPSERTVSCDLRASEPLAFKAVKVRYGSGKKSLTGTRFTSFDHTKQSTAWLFLIDNSDSRRARTVQKSVEVVMKLAEKREGKRQFGLAIFSDKLTVLAPLSATKETFDEEAGKIKAAGSATELYRSVKDAIELMGKEAADRKAVVVISDGKAEDRAYTHEQVVAAAKKHGVTIYGIGYAERASDFPHLQVLRRMAEETGGSYVQASISTKELPEDYFDKFFGYVENGGRLQIPLNDLEGKQEFEITAELDDGRTASSRYAMTVPARPAAKPDSPQAKPKPGTDPKRETDPKPASVTPKSTTEEAEPPKSFVGKLLDAAKKNRVAAGVAGAGILTLLLGGIVLMLRSREPETPNRVSTVVTAPSMAPTDPSQIVYGWLEFLDAGSTKVPITSTTVRIGRHKDNDVQIANNSVHRRHAIMHMTPVKKFIVQNLGTKNGVYVNSTRHEQTELLDGDLIELGEVRLRFV